MAKQGPPEPTIEDLYETASASVAAQTLLDAMRPQLERAFDGNMQLLFNAPPELGALLDARAKLKVVWDMQQGLKRDAKRGQKAVDIMNNLLVASINKA
jgi:hypothetical protein